MADDKSKVGGRDRDLVATGQDYEVDDFAQKHGISRQQVEDLIAKHGNDRKTLDAAAVKLPR